MANLLASAGAGGGAGAAASSLLTGLLAYWKLDEASGTRADATANGNNLTANNSVGQGTGKLGNAASCTAASTQYLSVAPGSPLTPKNASRSITGWVKPNGVGATRGVWSTGNAPLDGGTVWFVRQTAGNVFSVFHGGAYHDGTTPISAGTWYHVAYTFNAVNNGWSLYVNGAVEISGTNADAQTAFSSVYLGVSFSGYFDGLLDETGVWNVPLTATQVSNLYASGTPPAYPFTGVP